MSDLKFDKNNVSQTKTKLSTLKSEMETILKDVNTNFDLIKTGWDGQRSETILSDIETINKSNAVLMTSVNDNIEFLESAIKTFEEAESVAVSSGKPVLENFFSNFANLHGLGNTYIIEFEGKTYKVVKTDMDPLEYAAIINSKALSQKTDHFSGCLMVAQWYAYQMYSGITPTRKDFETLRGNPSGNINRSFKSENIEDIKAELFNSINNRQPMVVKVTSKQVSRHYVTAIGFTTDVTDPSQITEKNILVLDPATGKVSTLYDSGWGERAFLAQQNEFEVIGPNANLMAKIEGQQGAYS